MRIPFIPLVLTALGLVPFFASSFAFIWADGERATLEPLLRAAANPQADELRRLEEAKTLLVLGLQSLFFYSAAILSFLGGIRWGMAIAAEPQSPHPLTLMLGVFAALIAWTALVIAFQPSVALLMLIGAFGLHLLWDLASVRAGIVVSWYAQLRTLATVGAVVALALAWARLNWPG
jgi:hypothetical protein